MAREPHTGIGSIGGRLAFIRGSTSQRIYAEQIGIPLKTYQTYEQGKRDPDLRTLASLHERGWNLNWVLMGEGEKRLDAQKKKPSGSASINLEHMLTAIHSVEKTLGEREVVLPALKKAHAIALVYEMLGNDVVLDLIQTDPDFFIKTILARSKETE